MIELYKLIIEKGGIFGIISLMAIMLLTAVIRAIKTSRLDMNESYLFWIHLLKSIRTLILVPTVFFFLMEAYRMIDTSLAKWNDGRKKIEEELRAIEIKRQQLKIDSILLAEKARIRQQQEELERIKEQSRIAEAKLREEIKVREEQEKLRQQAALEAAKKKGESSVTIKPSGLNVGDCCTVYFPYSDSRLTLRNRTLSSYETSRMNECRECSDSEYINQNTEIGYVDHGDFATYLGKSGRWYKVKIGNKIGFMSASFSGVSTLRKC